MVTEPIDAEVTKRPTREYRAAATFLLTGVFTLLLVLLYGQTVSSVPAIGVVKLAGPVIGGVLEVAIALGLGLRRTWAYAAMTPALWILALSGVLTFIAALARGSLDIPIGPILAIWALRAPPSAMPRPTPDALMRRAIAPVLMAALVVVAAWPLVVPTLTRPGGPLIVDAPDLDLQLQTATPCPGGAGPAHDPPDLIDVVLRWTWARSEPMPGGTDAVAFSWATGGGEESGGYFLDQPIAQQPGITEEDRSSRLVVYRSDLAVSGFEPGSMTIRLRRPNELTAGPGLVQVAAKYAHHETGIAGVAPTGLWTRAATITCEW